MLLLEQMLVLFLIICVGYYCYKRGIITEEVNSKLSAIVVNIANPALILSGGMVEERIQGEELLLMAVLTVAVYLSLILLGAFLPQLLGVEKKSRGAYRAMTVFGNIGFMGFPIISAVYGQGALLYATPFIIALNVLIYTYGISVMRVKSAEKNVGEISSGGKDSEMIDMIKKIFNVGVIASIITFAIYLSGIRVPAFVEKTASLLGGMTAPVSMMIIGASLAATNLKSLFLDRRMMLFVLFRLLAVPIVGMALICHFVDNETIRGVCLVMLAAPVASMTTMLARQYDGNYELTAKGVALSTVLSVITMPLIQMLF